MPAILVGTSEGLHELDVGASAHLEGAKVEALARGHDGWWAITDGRKVWRSGEKGWSQFGALVGEEARSLLPIGDDVLIGTSGAHLLRLRGRRLDHVESFDVVAGRSDWYTPWGGPPDTRWLDASDGAVYANVHVGGIVRSTDDGRTWEPTALDIHADAHQVVAHEPSGLVLAATAEGLAVSADKGASWTITHEGLHATYLRAVAVCNGTVLVSASDGPGGEHSALYRRPLGGGVFALCADGLPKWLGDNVDTGCLATKGPIAAFGTTEGTVWLSADAGESWRPVSIGLPPISCLAMA